MLVALEYLDFTKIVRCCSATSCHSMLITRKNSDLQWSQPFLYIRARNADVHHNLNVSNPVPKVYTGYDNTMSRATDNGVQRSIMKSSRGS